MAALRCAVVGVLSAVAGFLVANQFSAGDSPAAAREPVDPRAGEIARLASRIDELSEELDTARRDEALLRAELSRTRRTAASEGSAPGDGATPPPSSRFTPGGGPGRWIQGLDEAEGAYERAVAAGDLEALWLLGADLLAFGEEGYPLFEKLLERFLIDAEKMGEPMEKLWGEEELWLGRFFRAFAEEHESFLAYGLSLAERDAEELGPALDRFRRELFDDELLPMLLAFHGGENAELTAGWLDHLESRLALPDLGGADEDSILFGLAQIPGDRAAELLVHWIETQSSHRDDAIEALVLQGSPRAIAALRALLPSIEDAGLRAAIERRLGP